MIVDSMGSTTEQQAWVSVNKQQFLNHSPARQCLHTYSLPSVFSSSISYFSPYAQPALSNTLLTTRKSKSYGTLATTSTSTTPLNHR